MSWSLGVTVLLVILFKRWRGFWQAAKMRRNLIAYLASAFLLSINWLLYIWAVNAGFIIEASLGYFINPLLNVACGMVFFGERIRKWQWVALGLALLGVLYLTIHYGSFPWISLVLAFSFASYGLLHKKNTLGAIDGLCLETALMFIPATLFLIHLEATGSGSFGNSTPSQQLLLAGCGIITTAPLLLFGFAAQRIHLSTLGLLQYLAPTINLLLGLFVYGEPFPLHRFIGFSLIWLALLLFLLENLSMGGAKRARSLA
jgi:chloramphenicol-sensitive protein RarD